MRRTCIYHDEGISSFENRKTEPIHKDGPLFCNSGQDHQSFTQTRLTDPLQILPFDIWTEFLLYSVESSVRRALELSLVSQRWFNAITNMPILWEKIELTCRDDPEEIRICLLFSRDFPLQVSVEVPLERDVFKEILFSIKSRIKRLSFIYCPYKPSPFLDFRKVTADIRRNLDLLHPVDGIEYVEVENVLGNGPTEEDFFTLLPPLRAVFRTDSERLPSLFNYSIQTLPSSQYLQRVEQLSLVDVEWNDICKALAKSPALNRLDLIEKDSKSSNETETEVVESLPSRFITNLTINGPNLVLPMLLFFKNSIQRLTLHLDSSALSQFLHFSIELPHLFELDMKLTAKERNSAKATVFLPLFSSLRHIRIYTSTLSAELPNLQYILDVMGRIAPALQEFYLYYWGTLPGDLLLSCLSSLPDLDKFWYNGTATTPTNSTPVILQKLQTLNLGDAVLMKYLIVPNIVSLDMSPSGFQPAFSHAPQLYNFTCRKGDISTLDTHSEFFKSVQKISWHQPPAMPVSLPLSLSNLHTFSLFGTSNSDIISYNEILVGLILEPTAAPRLERIEMGHFPEFDILFRMLEIRNILQKAKIVSPIKFIGLPGLPAPWILKPLTRLLGGNNSDLPSDEELACYIISTDFFNLDCTGCQCCLRSGWNCISPIFGGVISKSMKEKKNIFRGSGKADTVQSSSAKEWITRWRERRKPWIEEYLKFTETWGRLHHCERHDPVIVTALTLHSLLS